MATTEKAVIPNAAWRAEAERRFGPDPKAWRFRCPSCGHEQSVADFEALGADGHRAAHECIGRVLVERGELSHEDAAGDGQPCDWTAFGLFELASIVRVEDKRGGVSRAFPFADVEGAVDGDR